MVMVAVIGVEVFYQIPDGNPAGKLYKHHGDQLCPARELSNSMVAIMSVNDLLDEAAAFPAPSPDCSAQCLKGQAIVGRPAVHLPNWLV